MKNIKRLVVAALTLAIDVPAFALHASAADFSTELSFDLLDTRIKANPQMTLTLAQENGEEELGHVTLKIPAGFRLPSDAAVPNEDQIGAGEINIAAGPGCRPGAPTTEAKAP